MASSFRKIFLLECCGANDENRFRFWKTVFIFPFFLIYFCFFFFLLSTFSFDIKYIFLSYFSVIHERANGIKQSLQTTFVNLDESTFDGSILKYFKPLLYVLTYFHAVMQVSETQKNEEKKPTKLSHFNGIISVREFCQTLLTHIHTYHNVFAVLLLWYSYRMNFSASCKTIRYFIILKSKTRTEIHKSVNSLSPFYFYCNTTILPILFHFFSSSSFLICCFSIQFVLHFVYGHGMAHGGAAQKKKT